MSISPKVSLTADAYSHLNIGAGRVVWQDIVRIDVAIKKRQFHKNDVILESFKRAKDTNGRLHLLGLVREPYFVPSRRSSLIHDTSRHTSLP